MIAPTRLFVLGDSISIGYGPYLEDMLAGRFNYDRKGYTLLNILPMDSPLVNGGDSHCVLAFLHSQTTPPDPGSTILLLNCGLHDLRVNPHNGVHQVEPEIYSRNLKQIQSVANSAGYLPVWVHTTPVADDHHNRLIKEYYRYNSDVIAYNQIADTLMRKSGIPCIDLYTFTLSLCAQPEHIVSLFTDHAHFTPLVSQLQGAYIAGWLEAFYHAW